MTRKLAVIGSGSWGTAASGLLSPKYDEVEIWSFETDVAQSINERHMNCRQLTSYVLPGNVHASNSYEDVISSAEALVMAVPSSFLRGVCEGLAPFVKDDTPIVVLTKGIEPHTHLLMGDLVAGVIGGTERIAALSGPNHAEEISQHMISAAVVASGNPEVATYFQNAFHSQEFRVYTSDDIRGVEVCAAVKNVVAIACGVCWGLGLGDNALAVLMTRGLAEISRIATAMGGSPLTCMGLAGMGDLIATCTSKHSRNRTFGEAFSKGTTLEEYEKRTGMVVEGARAALSAWELSRELSIEAPLTDAVHAILYDGMRTNEAIDLLLDRRARVEFYGLDTEDGEEATS